MNSFRPNPRIVTLAPILPLVFCIAFSASAEAALITETLTFTASAFHPSPAPQDPVNGSFTVTFDPAVSSTGSLDAISLTIFGHTYTLAEVGYHSLTGGEIDFGALVNGINTIPTPGSNDFVYIHTGGPASCPFDDFQYTVVGNTAGFEDGRLTCTITPGGPPTLPEPSTLALLGIGLAGIGLARQRKLH